MCSGRNFDHYSQPELMFESAVDVVECDVVLLSLVVDDVAAVVVAVAAVVDTVDVVVDAAVCWDHIYPWSRHSCQISVCCWQLP